MVKIMKCFCLSFSVKPRQIYFIFQLKEKTIPSLEIFSGPKKGRLFLKIVLKNVETFFKCASVVAIARP